MEEWLERHRLLSAVAGGVGVIVAILAATQTIWSLFHSEPLLPYVLVKAPQWGKIVLAIAFVAIYIFCVAVVVKVYRQTKQSKKIEPQKIEERDLADTLTTMHRRLIELQKEKATHMKVGFEVFRKILPALAYRLDKITEKEWATFENDIKTKIHQAIPPKPYMSIRGRFNFKKWARLNAQWKERVYLRASSIARKARDELLNTKNWTLADGMKIAEWADGYGWGIKELRDNDPQWKGLYESIDNRLRIDDVLGGLIKDHIDLSRLYNNITLLVHISAKFKDDIYSLILYEALVGSPMSPEQVDMGLNEVLGKIEERLNAGTTTAHCCVMGNAYQVSANNQGNDKDTVFITLGTSSFITGIKALMGAGLPVIIEGGPNANFITFKITELPPNVSLGYLIDVVSNAEKPYKFTAWSEATKSNIAATFTGPCRKVVRVGPVETALP